MNMTGEAWIKEKFGMQHIWSAETYDLYYQTLRKGAAKREIEVLEFWPEQGWEPLCKYLGKDVPEEEFPRLNEKKGLQDYQGDSDCERRAVLCCVRPWYLGNLDVRSGGIGP
ncbi:hypothetical protein B0O99DRAFT_704297 [Bisporella sp. PMI_857]|nr:hypothetical protein B0O99DRAFT_704297 [Bisporella sp. PMI_857]